MFLLSKLLLEAYRQLQRQGQPHLHPEGEVLRQRALELGISAADLATTGLESRSRALREVLGRTLSRSW